MINNLLRRFVQFFIARISYRKKYRILNLLFRSFNIDPLLFSYNRIGVLKYRDTVVSGEDFFINEFLFSKLRDSQELIFFDVGANVGNYSNKLALVFPGAKIFAFEPLSDAFRALNDKFSQNKRVVCVNSALGFRNENTLIYSYSKSEASEHACLYQNVLIDIHGAKDVKSEQISIFKLDDFCYKNNIKRINLLKIDTEGNEYNVLMGAKDMMESSAIDFIQFEFNEMNVISRIFFKDFFELLHDRYNIYRLDSNALIPINEYNTFLEIFKFQNFIAIRSGLLETL